MELKTYVEYEAMVRAATPSTPNQSIKAALKRYSVTEDERLPTISEKPLRQAPLSAAQSGAVTIILMGAFFLQKNKAPAAAAPIHEITVASAPA